MRRHVSSTQNVVFCAFLGVERPAALAHDSPREDAGDEHCDVLRLVVLEVFPGIIAAPNDKPQSLMNCIFVY